jgi:phosphoribosyl 1,2-cyclic phosphate phosphodiesterase
MSASAVSDVELLFLGSGTSAGVPIIGCDCDVCTSDDPRDCRTRPSICMRFSDPDGVTRLVLIDASPDLREQALRERLVRCDSILFTHEHFDHTFGLDEVRRFNAIMKSSIDIWAEEPTLDFLGRVYRHIFAPEMNVNVSFVAKLVPRELQVDRALDLFGLRFTPLRLLHGKLPVLGFRIEALDETGDIANEQPSPLPLAYCTDVSTIPDETWPTLEGLRHVVLDMLRYKPHPTHFSVDQAIEAAQRIGATASWFTHMTHDIRHADLDGKLPESMGLAYDGLVLR